MLWGSIFKLLCVLCKSWFRKQQTFRDSNEKPDIWLDKFFLHQFGIATKHWSMYIIGMFTISTGYIAWDLFWELLCCFRCWFFGPAIINQIHFMRHLAFWKMFLYFLMLVREASFCWRYFLATRFSMLCFFFRRKVRSQRMYLKTILLLQHVVVKW